MRPSPKSLILDLLASLPEGPGSAMPVRALVEAGAREVHAVVTHPVLSGPAIKRIDESPLREVIVTDTIPLRPAAEECGKLTVVTVSDLLGEAIRRINNEESVSSLFI